MFSNVILLIYSFFMCVSGHTGIRNILTILMLLTILILYSYKIIDKIRKIPASVLNAYLFFCFTLLLASLLVNDANSLKVTTDFFKCSFPFLLIYLLPKSDDGYKYILFGLALGIAYIGVYGVYDYILLERDRVQGLYDHPNFMGMQLALVLPFTVTYFAEFCHRQDKCKWLKNFISICVILGVIGLLLTKSRGAILGFGIGFVVTGTIYCIKNYNGIRLLKLMTVICIASCVFLGSLYLINGNKLSRGYDNERLLLIESSYNMWNDHKLYGVGLANWAKEYSSKYILPQAKEPDLQMPHNIFAYYFSTTGLIGGVGFCTFILLIAYFCFGRICEIKNGGLYTLAILWTFISIGFHSCVDAGLIAKGIFRCFNFLMGFSVSMIEFNRTRFFKKEVYKNKNNQNIESFS